MTHAMIQLREDIKACRKCELCRSLPREKVPVPGDGNWNADIMLIGECPGKDEVQQGRPFVGMAGAILDRALHEAGLSREEVYVANLINCWSRQGTKNTPSPVFAIEKCKGWLWKQMQVVKPKIVVPMGGITVFKVLGLRKQPLKPLIGKEYTVDWADFTIIPCYHPSYVQMGGSTKAYNSIVSVFKQVKETHEKDKQAKDHF